MNLSKFAKFGNTKEQETEGVVEKVFNNRVASEDLLSILSEQEVKINKETTEVAIEEIAEMEEEPVYEPISASEVTDITTVDENDYKIYLSKKLGLDQQRFTVYKKDSLKYDPIDFREIKDTKGLIKQKVVEFELRSKLSCMPFDLIGLNPNVVQIQDYDIFFIGNKKYVGSSNRINNPDVVEMYETKWRDLIECGDVVNENLMISAKFEGKQIETISLNKAEIDKLLDRFSGVNARVVFLEDKLLFVAGV